MATSHSQSTNKTQTLVCSPLLVPLYIINLFSYGISEPRNTYGFYGWKRARASPGFFVEWRGKTEGPKAESGGGVLGEGQQPLPTS